MGEICDELLALRTLHVRHVNAVQSCSFSTAGDESPEHEEHRQIYKSEQIDLRNRLKDYTCPNLREMGQRLEAKLSRKDAFHTPVVDQHVILS